MQPLTVGKKKNNNLIIQKGKEYEDMHKKGRKKRFSSKWKAHLRKTKSAPSYHFLLIWLAKIKTFHSILDTKTMRNDDLPYAESRRTCGLSPPDLRSTALLPSSELQTRHMATLVHYQAVPTTGSYERTKLFAGALFTARQQTTWVSVNRKLVE